MGLTLATNGFELSRFNLPSGVSQERVDLPDHVWRGGNLENDSLSVLRPKHNAVVISDRPLISRTTVAHLQSFTLDIKGNVSELPGLLDRLIAVVADDKSSLSYGVLADLVSMSREIQAIAATISEISSPVGYHIYNGRARPTHFHDDHGMVIGLRTLFGPSTEFVHNQDVLPKSNGSVLVRSGASRFTLSSDELLIFRGRSQVSGFEEGLIHRAPDFSGPERIFFSVFGRIDETRLQSR